MIIRPATEEDFADVVRINSGAEEFLNSQASLTARELGALHLLAAFHRVACVNGLVVGFVLAVRSGVAHADPNYRWFAQRYAQFMYIDRIVVAEAARGQGVGRAMYRELFKFSHELGIPRVTCEIDCEPPNAASSIFHSKFGFTEVGRHAVDGGKKTVSLQVAPA